MQKDLFYGNDIESIQVVYYRVSVNLPYIMALKISRDGNNLAYLEHTDNNNYNLVLNGNKILRNYSPMVGYSEDLTRIAYLSDYGENLYINNVKIDTPSEYYQFQCPVLSSNGLDLAYIAVNRNNQKQHLFKNNKVISSGYYKIYNIIFSPDGSKLAYIAEEEREGEFSLYIDKTHIQSFGYIGGLAFSHDGRYYAYRASYRNSSINEDPLSSFIMLNGKKLSGRFDDIWEISFTPISFKLCYIGSDWSSGEPKNTLMLDDKSISPPECSEISKVRYSDDETRICYFDGTNCSHDKKILCLNHERISQPYPFIDHRFINDNVLAIAGFDESNNSISYTRVTFKSSKTIKGGKNMSRRLEDLVDIANPQQPHCATILLLDVSGSMSGEKISQLNQGLKAFKEDIEQDDLASKRVDLAIVTFDDTVQVNHNFSSIEDFDPPTLSTGGSTSMGDGILKAAEMIEERKQQYKQKGIDYYRPWIFMITDGEPTDMQPGDPKWSKVVKTVHDGEANKKFMFFGVAVEPANTEILGQITPPNRQPVRLKQGRFRELFQWLSKSQSKVSSSNPGEQIALESPVAAGWGEIAV
jgi:uncharacterized protein YegL